jgi:hypothetical protein
MSTSATIFARLNELRVANGQKPLKRAGKVEAMNAEIAKLAPKRYRSPVAAYARELGINPKVARALLRRHFTCNDHKWSDLTPEIKAKLDEQAARAKAA